MLLRGLPADPAPGPTPRRIGDEPATPRAGHAWLAMASRRLGHELGYAREKSGSLVHHVFPVRELAMTQSNASSRVELGLHTENAFHPVRPDHLVLYAVRVRRPLAPATRLVMIDDVLRRLSDDELAVLRQRRFTVRVVESHRVGGERDVEVPLAVLSGSWRRPVVRWHGTLRATDDVAARAARSFAEAAASWCARSGWKPATCWPSPTSAACTGASGSPPASTARTGGCCGPTPCATSAVWPAAEPGPPGRAPTGPGVLRPEPCEREVRRRESDVTITGTAPTLAPALPVPGRSSSWPTSPAAWVTAWSCTAGGPVRRASQLAFLSLRDRSATVQVVCRDAGALAGVNVESALRVHGTVRPCTSSPLRARRDRLPSDRGAGAGRPGAVAGRRRR